MCTCFSVATAVAEVFFFTHFFHTHFILFLVVCFSSKGAGDLNIHAIVRELVSETYILEDCLDYDPLTSESSKWIIPSAVQSTYTVDGWKVMSSSYQRVQLDKKLLDECAMEFTVIDFNNTGNSIGSSIVIYAYTNGETTPNQIILSSSNPPRVNAECFVVDLHRDLVKGAVYRIEYTETQLKVYEDNTLIGSKSNSIGFPTRFEFHIGGNGRYAVYKDVKVKPL